VDAGQGHRRLTAAAVIVALAAVAPSGAAAAVQPVSVQFAAFAPARLDALPGDAVEWSNTSPRAHTVTADGGAFASELPAGGRFRFTFENVGGFAYHCTIHPSMTGEVDVRRLILDPLPPSAVPAGARVTLTGRSADGAAPVTIARADGAAGPFVPLATAVPAASGAWSVTVAAVRSAVYEAAAGADTSEARTLLVTTRRVRIRATRAGVHVTVVPSDPGGRIMLQRHEKRRFGWWPVARARLDYVSTADFRLRGPGRVRAVLVARDLWTPLAVSPVVVLGRA
jgi:plastocyanin